MNAMEPGPTVAKAPDAGDRAEAHGGRADGVGLRAADLQAMVRSIQALRGQPRSTETSLESRIQAARSALLGANGPLPPETVGARVEGQRPGEVRPGAAARPPRQRAFADEVTEAADRARDLLASLSAPAGKLSDPEELTARRAAVTRSLDLVSRESSSDSPRKPVMDSRLNLLVGEPDGSAGGQTGAARPRGQLGELLAVVSPGDGFQSESDDEQLARIERLKVQVSRIDAASESFFATTTIGAGVVQAQMRVVRDAAESSRAALRAAGLTVAEASSPAASLVLASDELPDLPLEHFLDWIAQVVDDEAITQVVTAGSYGRSALRLEVGEVGGLLDEVIRSEASTSVVGALQADESVARELGDLRSQLSALEELCKDPNVAEPRGAQ